MISQRWLWNPKSEVAGQTLHSTYASGSLGLTPMCFRAGPGLTCLQAQTLQVSSQGFKRRVSTQRTLMAGDSR